MIPNIDKPNVKWDLSKRILTKKNILTHAQCDSLVQEQLKNLHKGEDKYPGVFTTSFQSCLLQTDHYIHDCLQPLYSEIISFLDLDISFVEPYEIKKYQQNDYFGEHTDNYFSIEGDFDRKVTVVIMLTDKFVGGELNILKHKFYLDKGSAIAFPSFFPHSVSPILSGERETLIAWLWGKNWR